MTSAHSIFKGPPNEIDNTSLVRHVYELEAENARFKKSEELTRKNQFRATGAFLLVLGTVITLIAYPSYNTSTMSNVLMMAGVTALFLGGVTLFLNTEKFLSSKVAERFHLSTTIVLDDLLRDLRLRNKGIYIPASRTGSETKVFVPLRRGYKVPPAARLKDDHAFLIGLSDTAEEGVLMQPLGYELFTYTEEDMKVDWKSQEDADSGGHGGREQPPSESEHLRKKLEAVLVNGLQLADSVTVSDGDGELRVSLQNSSYFSACEVIMERAPQVCKQIGCPLCSLIACIYTEHVDKEVTIEDVHRSHRNINVTCKVRPEQVN
jgi:hypothetical protein